MRLVEPLYAIAEKLVTREIAKAVAVSTAMDFWTSVAGDHYLALTYHWMDDSLNLRSALLDCVPFPDKLLETRLPQLLTRAGICILRAEVSLSRCVGRL
jgi:hypothetical protein